jgi:hypothetical protein
LRESGNIASESCVVDLVDEDPNEGGGLVTGVRLELGVDLDDERGGNGGKQTSLISHLAHVQYNFMREAHKDQGSVQVLFIFHQEFLVVFVGDLTVCLVESCLVVFSIDRWYVLLLAARWP